VTQLVGGASPCLLPASIVDSQVDKSDRESPIIRPINSTTRLKIVINGKILRIGMRPQSSQIRLITTIPNIAPLDWVNRSKTIRRNR
jgi:hypothetical protein